MRSLQSRLVYWYLRSRKSPIDPGKSLAQQRLDMERDLSRAPLPKTVTVEQAVAGDRPAEWLRTPQARNDRTVLYLHGGGYVAGSCLTARPVAAGIAVAARCPVLSLDYRLAPEDPYPAALDDSVGAFKWLVAQGFAPGRIAIAGDSAGGGLAVATALALRGQGGPMPGALLCFSPWTDLTLSGESCATRAKTDPIVSRDSLAVFADGYVAGRNPRDPLLSPRFSDLSGMPPMLVQVGSNEVLFSDSEGLADSARAAGVDVTFETWDGMWHVWHGQAGIVPEGKRAIESACSFFEVCLSG